MDTILVVHSDKFRCVFSLLHIVHVDTRISWIHEVMKSLFPDIVYVFQDRCYFTIFRYAKNGREVNPEKYTRCVSLFAEGVRES